MNKKFAVAWAVVFIAWMIGSMVIHGMLLRGDYMAVQQLFRPETEGPQYFHWMLLAHLMLAGAFVWIYARGVEPRPWAAQGVRFGIVVALLTVVPTYLIYYVVQPTPAAMAIKQIVYSVILLLLLGVLVAFLYRDKTAA